MAISTLFSDQRLANQIGGIILVVPQMIFIWLITQETGATGGIYALYWIPIVPACSIFVELSINHNPMFASYQIIHSELL